MPQRGAFLCFLMLASETGNLIPADPKYIRSRAQVDPRLTQSLTKVGLIEEIALDSDSQEVKELRRIFSGGRPPPEEEGRTESEKRVSPPERLCRLTPARPQTQSEARHVTDVLCDTTVPPGVRRIGRQPEFDLLLKACLEARVTGSDWNGQTDVVRQQFGFVLSDRQHQQLERQLNDRAHR